MQTFRTSTKSHTHGVKRIEEKKKFIRKLELALSKNKQLSTVIRGPFTKIPESMPLYNPKTHTITYVKRPNEQALSPAIHKDSLGSRVGPTSLLDRFIKNVDKTYKTKINGHVLENMLKEAKQDLQNMKKVIVTPPKVVRSLSIKYRNGVVHPNVYPDGNREAYQWELQTTRQPFVRVGVKGQRIVRPNAPSGTVRLRYNNNGTELFSNQIDITRCIKNQMAVAKRKQWNLHHSDAEFKARCKGIAGRILRLTQSKRPIGSNIAPRFSMRIFQDRVARLPEHLNMTQLEIASLCQDKEMNEKYIQMVEFCEPTVYLDPAGRRRNLKQIATGSKLKLALSAVNDSDSDSDSDEFSEEEFSEEEQQSDEFSIGDTVIITRNGKYNGVEGKLVSRTPTGFQVDIGAVKTIPVASSSLQKVGSAIVDSTDESSEEEFSEEEEQKVESSEEEEQSDEFSIGDTVIITRNGKYNGVEGKLVSRTPTGFQVDIGAVKTIPVASTFLAKVSPAIVDSTDESSEEEFSEEEEQKVESSEEEEQSGEFSIGDTVIITRNGKYNGVEGKLVSETPTGFQVDIGAAKTIPVASSSLQKVGSAIVDSTDESSEEEFSEEEEQKVESSEEEEHPQLAEWQQKVREMDQNDKLLMEAKFKEFDRNASGGDISVGELIAAYGGQNLKNVAIVARKFELYDIDKTASLSLDEFMFWCVDSDGEWATAPVENYMFATKRPDDGETVYYKTVLGTWEWASRGNFFHIQTTGSKIKVTGAYLKNSWVQVKPRLDFSDSETDPGSETDPDEMAFNGDTVLEMNEFSPEQIQMAADGLSKEDGGLNVDEIEYFLKRNHMVKDSDIQQKREELLEFDSWIREKLLQVLQNAHLPDDEFFSDSGVDERELETMDGGRSVHHPPGELTRMLANMSDDWASSEDELNFAPEDDFVDESAINSKHSSGLEFAESSAVDTKTSSGLEFAESSAVETDSGNEMSDGLEFAVSSDAKSSSDLEFAESSAVETDGGKSQTSGLDFALSSDYE